MSANRDLWKVAPIPVEALAELGVIDNWPASEVVGYFPGGRITPVRLSELVPNPFDEEGWAL